MNKNKYDNFYDKKSIFWLIEQLRFNKINGGDYLNDWHEALIRHIENRDLSKDERKLFDHILNTDSSQLKMEKNQQMDVANNSPNEKNRDSISINTTLIAAAGKSIKNIVLIIVVMIITLFIWFLFAPSIQDTNELVIAYTVLGVINILCSFISLSLLYSAGDSLEKSVK